MKDSNELILGNIIKLTRSSEKKFKLGNFKGAIDDKIKTNAILKSKSCDEKIIEKYREELSRLYSSKFDLIFDHKLKIDEIKRNELVKMLKQNLLLKHQGIFMRVQKLLDGFLEKIYLL